MKTRPLSTHWFSGAFIARILLCSILFSVSSPLVVLAQGDVFDPIFGVDPPDQIDLISIDDPIDINIDLGDLEPPLDVDFGDDVIPADREVQNQVTNPSAQTGAMASQDTPLKEVVWGCSLFPTLKFQGCVSVFLYGILKAVGAITSASGRFLNVVIGMLVVDMNSLVGPGGAGEALRLAWALLRDVANIMLVFITVFIGLSMIVGATGFGSKQMLFKVVLAALFVNFSFLLSTLVIDASNLFSIAIYDELMEGQCVSTGVFSGPSSTDCLKGGVSSRFLHLVDIQTLLAQDALGSVDAANPNVITIKDSAHVAIWWIAILGIPMLLALAFVFALTAGLIFIRFFVLMLLMVLSPVGLALWLTGVSHMGKKWWHQLLEQSFFLPIMMFMWLIMLQLLEGLKGVMYEGGGNTSFASVAKAVGTNTTQDANYFGMIIFFVMVVAGMLYSLIIAKTMGAAGASTIVASYGTWKNRAQKGWNAGMEHSGINYFRSKRAYEKAQKRDEEYARAHEKDKDGKYIHNDLNSTSLRNAAGRYFDRKRSANLKEKGARYAKTQKEQKARMGEVADAQTQQQLLADAQLLNQYTGKDDAAILAAHGQAELDKVQEARKRISTMNKRQMEWAMEKHADVFATQDVSEHYSAATMSALDDNPMLASEAAKVRNHRAALYENTIAPKATGGGPAPRGDTKRAKRMARNMTDAERATLGRSLDDLVRKLPPAGSAARAGASLVLVQDRFDALSPKDVANLNPNTLTDPTIASRLTSQHLKAIDQGDKLENQADRQAIYRIVTGPGGDPSANSYVTDPKNQPMWA